MSSHTGLIYAKNRVDKILFESICSFCLNICNACILFLRKYYKSVERFERVVVIESQAVERFIHSHGNQHNKLQTR